MEWLVGRFELSRFFGAPYEATNQRHEMLKCRVLTGFPSRTKADDSELSHCVVPF